MKRKYNHSEHFDFAVTCNYCMRTIMRLPCMCVGIKTQRHDVGDWAYFHYSCYKKQLKEDKGHQQVSGDEK